MRFAENIFFDYEQFFTIIYWKHYFTTNSLKEPQTIPNFFLIWTFWNNYWKHFFWLWTVFLIIENIFVTLGFVSIKKVMFLLWFLLSRLDEKISHTRSNLNIIFIYWKHFFDHDQCGKVPEPSRKHSGFCFLGETKKWAIILVIWTILNNGLYI